MSIENESKKTRDSPKQSANSPFALIYINPPKVCYTYFSCQPYTASLIYETGKLRTSEQCVFEPTRRCARISVIR